MSFTGIGIKDKTSAINALLMSKRNKTQSTIVYCVCLKGFIPLMIYQIKCPDCLHGKELEQLRYDYKHKNNPKMPEHSSGHNNQEEKEMQNID